MQVSLRSASPRVLTRGPARRIGGRLTVAGLAALVSCTVGPDYEPPEPEGPPQWSAPRTPGFDRSREPPAEWWRALRDPELSALVEDVAESNLDLAAAVARIREARALRTAASASLYPRLGASAGYDRTHISENAAGPISKLANRGIASLDLESFQAGFDASWEIDVFGATARAREAAGARLGAIEADWRDILITVTAELVRNYVELRGAQRRLAVLQSNVELQQETVRLTGLRVAGGLAPELDSVRARAQLETTRAGVPPLRAAIRATAHRIAVLTGRPPGTLLDELLRPRPLPVAPNLVSVGVPSELLRRRPDVRRAERELHLATAEIGQNTAELFPRFTLLGRAGLESERLSELIRGGSRTWTIGPSISWRLFEAGRIRAGIRAADARRDGALARYERTVLHALEEVESNLVRASEAAVEREHLATALDAQRRSARLAHDLHERGLQNFLTVLDAEGRLQDVEDRLAVAETNVLLRLVALYKALAGGW